jgi:RNA polymerase sigma factor (sigma-70 family)
VTTEQFKQHILPTRHKLYRFALSYLSVEEDARDVVQEVMLSAWEGIKDLRTVRNPEAWCMALTRNKALNLLKKKGRHYLPLAEQYDLPSGDRNPLQQTEANESFHKIRDLIAQLPEKQRAVIHLRDLEGYSYKEMAQILNLEMNHVKVLLFRARKQVKEQLTRVNDYGISKAQ